jgi:hypothetical protein
MQPCRVRIHGSFVGDAVTRIAYLWNTYLGGYDINLRASSVIDMVAGIRVQLADLAMREQSVVQVDAIDFAGHGYAGGWEVGLDLTDAQQPPGSPQHARWSSLVDLKPLWSNNNEGLTLRMCETAQGQRGRSFLAALAQTIGSKVRGWTGCYEIRPTGFEYTAAPDGRVWRTGNTGRHWQLVYRQQALSPVRRILTAPLAGCAWAGRMADLW